MMNNISYWGYLALLIYPALAALKDRMSALDTVRTLDGMENRLLSCFAVVTSVRSSLKCVAIPR